MQLKGQVLNVLSRNKFLTATKGYNSATNKENIGGSNSNLDLININALTKFGETLYPFVLKILSGNKILMSIKGHNSVKNDS